MDMKAQLRKIMEQNPFTHLGDAVYSILYQGIIHMDIPADAALSDTVLSKELAVSRTPVRSALLRLQDDGLLIQSKGQSFSVAPLEKAECRHLMEVRLAVEGQAAYWAAERITAEQQGRLIELLDGYGAACSAWEPDEIVESDHAFHQEIVDAAHNPILTDIYRQISPRVLHYRYFLFRQTPCELLKPIMGISVRHHQSVWNAICSGFGSVAREQLERDISGMMDIVGSW